MDNNFSKLQRKQRLDPEDDNFLLLSESRLIPGYWDFYWNLWARYKRTLYAESSSSKSYVSITNKFYCSDFNNLAWSHSSRLASTRIHGTFYSSSIGSNYIPFHFLQQTN